MSAAAPVVEAEAPAPVARGKKKLIIIAAAGLLLLGAVGGGALFYVKKKAAAAAAAAAEAGEVETGHAVRKPDPSHPPVFVPLEPFVVNLADRDVDRYAQIGVTLEIEDPKVADQLKLYMPAIRNGILMVMAHKTSVELLERAGKEQLAAEIKREAVRPLGIDLDEPVRAERRDKIAKGDVEDKAGPADAHDDEAAAKQPKLKAPPPDSPVKQVHFSNFIIQ